MTHGEDVPRPADVLLADGSVAVIRPIGGAGRATSCTHCTSESPTRRSGSGSSPSGDTPPHAVRRPPACATVPSPSSRRGTGRILAVATAESVRPRHGRGVLPRRGRESRARHRQPAPGAPGGRRACAWHRHLHRRGPAREPRHARRAHRRRLHVEQAASTTTSSTSGSTPPRRRVARPSQTRGTVAPRRGRCTRCCTPTAWPWRECAATGTGSVGRSSTTSAPVGTPASSTSCTRGSAGDRRGPHGRVLRRSPGAGGPGHHRRPGGRRAVCGGGCRRGGCADGRGDQLRVPGARSRGRPAPARARASCRAPTASAWWDPTAWA